MSDRPANAKAAPAPGPRPEIEPRVAAYRPISPRLRRWILLLALVTVVGLPWLMIQPHLKLRAAKAARAKAAALAACPLDAASAAPGCPGSRMPVMMVPARPPGPGG